MKGVGCDPPFSPVQKPEDETEEQTDQQTSREGQVKREIFPLDDDIARKPSQTDPAQIGP